MPVAEIIKRGLSNLTAQQLADMALAESQMARAAKARGDMKAYREHDTESAALCRLIKESK